MAGHDDLRSRVNLAQGKERVIAEVVQGKDGSSAWD